MANLNLSEFTEKLFVADADHTFIWDTAASISKRVSRNSWLNSGTLTSDAPVTISQTWNNAAVAFTGLKFNAAGTSGTNSAAASLLVDFQLNGVTQFSVTKAGRTKVGNIIDIGSSLLSWENPYLRTYSPFSCARLDVGAVGTVLLEFDAANTLALRNGAAAQTFRVYGAYPDTGINYARLALSCDTSGNATISTQALGTYTAGTVSINGVPVGRGKGSNTARNISIGDNSLGLNSTGGDNTAVGFYALGANGTGNYNTSFGSQSLFSSNSNHNVALGYLAGTFKTGGATNNPGNENIYIGSQTKALDTAQNNQIVIGYDATGIGSNSVVLGNDSITKTALKGNVGIGTTAPGAKLDIELTGQSTAFKIRNTSAVTLLDAQAVIDIGFSDSRRLIFSAAGDTINVPLFSNLNYINSIGKPLAFIQNNVNALTINSGNVGIGTTSPTSKLHVAETWNNAGTAFCAIKSVITDTNSAAGSDFLELYSGTSTQPLRMDINKTGQINIYGAWTDASNYERLSFNAPSAANAVIGTNKAGTGTARGLEFQTDGVTRITLSGTTNNVVVKQLEVSNGTVYNDANVALSINSTSAALLLGFYSSGSFRVSLTRATGTFGIATTGKFGWQTTGEEVTMRTAFGEYASGVVEVNNGTAGAFRDLRCRSVIQQPPATISPDTNGDLVVEATNNTTLTFRLKGTDGTVRSGTITLSV